MQIVWPVSAGWENFTPQRIGQVACCSWPDKYKPRLTGDLSGRWGKVVPMLKQAIPTRVAEGGGVTVTR